VTGVTVDAATKQESIDEFNRVWGFKAPLEWRFEAPPQPRRHGEAKAAASIEGDTDAIKFHRLVLRAFHPDLHGAKKRWSADQIIAAVNQAWSDSTGAK
jgi:hypothetical protein